ncbi:CLUMA_CG011884, isoform A [Clunio marinus]|uniref:CLUMA_CG011884, isoform A n=1 Tax=Clunio marinus TaxID=568069 RepID=A0A1J1IE95_9DIPT|nr:CLUMA_CG011884, isoform A [Clunio marinus]
MKHLLTTEKREARKIFNSWSKNFLETLKFTHHDDEEELEKSSSNFLLPSDSLDLLRYTTLSSPRLVSANRTGLSLKA